MTIFDLLEIPPHAPEALERTQWSSAQYEQVIRRLLRRLLNNPFGRIVVNEIVRVAKPDAKIVVDPNDGYFKHGKSKPMCWQGFGQTGVTINFVPAAWRSPDSVLMHELFHAVGYMKFDKYDPKKTWEDDALPPPFGNKGETLAMAAANLYRLGAGQRKLRIGYGDATRWDTPGKTSFEFAAHLDVFQKFREFHPALNRKLAYKLPRGYSEHRFNPFRWTLFPAEIAKQRRGVQERQRLDDLFTPPD